MDPTVVMADRDPVGDPSTGHGVVANFTSSRGGGVRGNTARQVLEGLWTEARGRQKQSNDPSDNQHNLNTPTTGRR